MTKAEPLAIVGMGCRFPGAEDVFELWRVLVEGRDTVGEIPAGRFPIEQFYDPRPGAPGKLVTRQGGFLESVDAFDASFFEISPREASRMDPQQRLLLEVAWHAIEDAGLLPKQLAGGHTGVFLGMAYNDYEDLMLQDSKSLDVYTNAGGFRGVAAGRLSYAFDLQGPSVVVDTACSSGLVSVHLACQSLWSGECEVALTGGANLILTPGFTIGFSRSGMIAADGRCKFGDARGDGFVRSDGVALLVLKTLRRAVADRDPIYAVIRGSASVNEGRSSGNLMTPGQGGQELLLSAAYESAGVDPSSVQYVECHGTGTRAGDPVELSALGAVLGRGRADGDAFRVGSVKTNIGHTEGVAGTAGLMKVALSIAHRVLPASLHFREPNPQVPWSELPLAVQTELGSWPRGDAPLVAGVSSFGIGGSDAHVVVAEPTPAPARDAQAPQRPELITLSGHVPDALREGADRLLRFMKTDAGGAVDLRDLAFTRNARRAHHDHRLALVAESREELIERLEAFLEDEPRVHTSVGHARLQGGKLVFVFPGQGGQWIGMGVQLLDEEPAFRRALERCDAAISRLTAWSVIDELRAEPGRSRLAEVDVIQPLLFSVQVAMAELWRSWGIEPDAVVGHSMGEVAAAVVSGALELDDAARVIVRRSEFLAQTRGTGTMLLAELSRERALEMLEGREDEVGIAAHNGPSSTVLSGDPAAIEALAGEIERADIFCRPVAVDVPAHSPALDRFHAAFVGALEGLSPRAPAIPLYSTVDAPFDAAPPLDADYWWRNFRQPVQLAEATARLLDGGHERFVELSPHPVLVPSLRQTVAHLGADAIAIGSTRKDEDEPAAMLGALGALYTTGYSVPWNALYAGADRQVVRLPSYAFQRDSYWLTSSDNRGARTAPARRGADAGHPILGDHIRSAERPSTHIWNLDLSVDDVPYLRDHCVGTEIVFPAAGYVEMALAAGRELFPDKPYQLSDVRFERSLVLPEDGHQTVQTVVGLEAPGQAWFTIYSKPPDADTDGDAWTLHARGALTVAPAERDAGELAGSDADQKDTHAEVSGPEHYESCVACGLEYGPLFQGVDRVWLGEAHARASLRFPEPIETEARDYQVQPAMLDAALQVLLRLVLAAEDGNAPLFLPTSAASIRVHEPGSSAAYVLARVAAPSQAHEAARAVGDVTVLDVRGRIVAEVSGLELGRADGQRGSSEAAGIAGNLLHETTWERVAAEEPAANGAADEPGAWLVFLDHDGIGESLQGMFESHGDRCIPVIRGERYVPPGDGESYFAVNPMLAEHFDALLRDGLRPDETLRGVVYLWSALADRARETASDSYAVIADGRPRDDAHAPALLRLVPAQQQATVRRLHEAHSVSCFGTLHLVQALARAALAPQPRLWLVSQGSQRARPGEAPSLAQATLWGMGRTIPYEHPEFRCTRIDLSAQPSAREVESLFAALRGEPPEDELALRDDERYAPRIRPAPPASLRAAARTIGPDEREAFVLDFAEPGILDSCVLRASRRIPPRAGEVEVEVASASLNFKDVLVVLGVIPPDAPGAGDFGFDFAGRITAVGEGVDGFRVGDEVIGLAPHSFRSFRTVSAEVLAHKPPALSFEEGAALGTAGVTAYYALAYLARVREGERVLVHSATGGVGMVALELCRRYGAEVFATAGTEEKRAYLRSLGVRHVLDSRSLDFDVEVMRRTGGEGVDVVLNALTGENIPKGLSVLRDYGRFIELGQVELLQNRQLGMRSFLRNITFASVDLLHMMKHRPKLAGELLRELVAMFADEPHARPAGSLAWTFRSTGSPARSRRGAGARLAPPPVTSFPVADAADAFRYLRQVRHIGKVAISFEDKPDELAVAPSPDTLIRDHGTYLVTGGLGGLGLAVASWLVDRGARHLVLTGRREPSADAEASLEALRRAGATIVVAQADVAMPGQVSSLVQHIEEQMPPLRGIVHAAGVLDDSTLLQLDPARFRRVLAPKVDGAINLHDASLRCELDFFVLFSSAASMLGLPGQGNYVAANAFLDALAHYRQSKGLPALSLNWGPWSDVGMAARPDRAGRLESQGLGSIDSRQGVKALELTLLHEAVQLGVMRLDGATWCESYPMLRSSSLFRGIQATGPAARRKSASSGGPGASEGELDFDALSTLAEADRMEAFQGYLRPLVARVLGQPVARVDLERPLPRQGFDSLMATELRNRVNSDVGIELPIALFLKDSSIRDLASFLCGQIATSAEPGADEPAGPAPAEIETSIPLDPAIRPAGADADAASPGHILLTGATGFLGAFLLRELLESTDAHIHCLVRSTNAGEGRDRLRQNLQSHQLWEHEYDDRVVVVSGDLSKPWLGVSRKAFDQLAAEIDVVYHCGALVNFLLDYESLREPNVLGTQEVLRLACARRNKPVNYISSLAIFCSGRYAGRDVSEEMTAESNEVLYQWGYAHSKTVAEKLLVEARERGLTINIFRTSLIGPDARTGAANDDLVTRLIDSAVQLSCAPEMDLVLNVAPVDFVAKAITHLGGCAASTGQTFHVANPRPTTWNDVVDLLERVGFPIQRKGFREWRDLVARHPQSPVFPFLSVLGTTGEGDVGSIVDFLSSRRFPSFQMQNVLDGLRGSDLACPPLDAEQLEKYLARRGVGESDSVTGCFSQIAFFRRVKQELARASRQQRSLALMFLTVLGLEKVQAQFGRQDADALIAQVGERLRGKTRVEDHVARLEGEQFAICLVDASRAQAMRAAERVKAGLVAEPFSLYSEEVWLDCRTVCLHEDDLAALDPDGDKPPQWLARELLSLAHERLSARPSRRADGRAAVTAETES